MVLGVQYLNTDIKLETSYFFQIQLATCKGLTTYTCLFFANYLIVF